MKLLYNFSTASPQEEHLLEKSARAIAKQIHTIAKQTKKFVNVTDSFHSFTAGDTGPLLYSFGLKTLHEDYTKTYDMVIIFQRNGCVAFELMGPGIGMSLFKNIPGELLIMLDKPLRDYLNAKPADLLAKLEPFKGDISMDYSTLINLIIITAPAKKADVVIFLKKYLYLLTVF